MTDYVQEAIKVLSDGGIVIYPTDTAFGVGCRMDNEEAVLKLFTVRKRPTMQATPVLVDTIKMMEEYILDIPDNVVTKLIERYWPGALTIVLPCKTEKIASRVRGGGDTVGLRIPNHPITRKLIHELGVPILGPSANFHSGKTPYEFNDLDPELVKLVDYVIPGECIVKEQSTVIDCSDKPWKILRQGAVRLRI